MRMRQRAPDTSPNLGMATPDLVEDGDRPQAGNALEQRYHLAVPNPSQRVMTTPLARRFPLRRQPRVLFDAIRGGDAEPGLGRGNDRRLGLTETHVQPHLVVGDVAAGQGRFLRMKNPLPTRPAATASQRAPRGAAPFAGFATSLGLRPPVVTHPATFSSRLTRVSHLVRRAARCGLHTRPVTNCDR
jgi:hypothetical protein